MFKLNIKKYIKNKKRARLNNQKGQALVEYVLILVFLVLVVSWGISIAKCNLHKFWVKVACEIIYPYPASTAQAELSKEGYCEPLKCTGFDDK
jgi:Flp pilus assembly pilin Flp